MSQAAVLIPITREDAQHRQGSDRLVDGDERRILERCLGDQETIERIAVGPRDCSRQQSMINRYRQAGRIKR
jgi:hypothetical protein